MRARIAKNLGTTILLAGLYLLIGQSALADNGARAPRSGFDALDLESPDAILKGIDARAGFFAGRFSGEVKEIKEDQNPKSSEPPSLDDKVEAAANLEPEKESAAKQQQEQKLREQILGRVDKTAPESFRNMVYNFRTGNANGAKKEAASYVDYLTDLMFELRVYTKMIGEAFIERDMIKDDEWVGVEQLLSWTMASARSDSGSPLKLTHKAAMKRITPDPNHQVEIYFFFTLSSNYSREMAADVERLWQVVKGDKNIKMAAMTLGAVPNAWMKSYRDYTGLTVPIFNGEELAKKFKIALVPAVVIVSPTLNTAYVKTGEQDFSRLYEFVRTAQGLPATLTPDLQRLATAPVGSLNSAQGKVVKVQVANSGGVGAQKISKSNSMERF